MAEVSVLLGCDAASPVYDVSSHLDDDAASCAGRTDS